MIMADPARHINAPVCKTPPPDRAQRPNAVCYSKREMTVQEKVYALFLLDRQVRGLRTRLDASLRMQRAQQNKLDQLQTQHRELTDQHRHAQVQATAMERQSKDAEERIVRLREQMNTVKNNKEYQALLVEVSSLKLEKGKLEDAALEALGKVDQIKAQLDDVAARIAEQQKLLSGAASQVESARAEVGEQLDQRTAERQAAAEELPPDVRDTFNRLAHVHDGEAMAPIVEEDRRRREYSCGGCYMSIPVERVNALMMGRQSLILCPSCERILYIGEEIKASIAK